MNEERLEIIRRYGKAARGRKELIKHLEGHRLTLKQAVDGHCFQCCGYYADGKIDCLMPHCSLHPFMAYNKNRIKQSTKAMSSDHMARMRAARCQGSNITL